MKAYKGTNKNMMCRDFQYELGKEYTYEGDVVLCESGFHACLKPIDCLGYYPYNGENRFFEVEISGVSGKRKDDDSKVVAKSIKFVREITDLNELLDGAEYIPHEAFINCKSLTSIIIPDSVTYISDSVFWNCSNLESVVIGNSVTSIGSAAFARCTSLTSVTIPDSVTSIGDAAFFNCWNLTSITIPDSVTEIGRYAFENCYFLTSVRIPDSVTSIGDWGLLY